MGAFYKPYKDADVKNSKPGYSRIAFLLPVDWIDAEASVVGNTAAGDRKNITTTHTVLEGKGAIPVYCAPKTIEAPGELRGGNGGKSWAWLPKIFIPGDSAALWDMLDGAVNRKYLVFVEDADNCANGAVGFVQFGCNCDPCEVSAGSFVGGVQGSDGQKGYELTFESFCKFFYTGTITELASAGIKE